MFVLRLRHDFLTTLHKFSTKFNRVVANSIAAPTEKTTTTSTRELIYTVESPLSL
jgi:hypothetical protein